MSVQLTTEQLQALGIHALTEQQRDRFLQQIGKMVFDNSMTQLIHTLTEEQLQALGYAIDSLDSFDSVMAYLLQTYPMFEMYLKNAGQDFTTTFIEEFKKGN